MRRQHHASVHRASFAVRSRGDRWESVSWSHQPDPFAVNPIRRSAILVVASALAFFVPLMVGGPNGALTIIAGGWLGLIGLALGIPVLILSVGEEIYRRIIEAVRPSVEQLDLSPRVRHILRRHGYDAITEIDATSDAGLLLLSNMEVRDLREIRRAISLWRYREWQARGFP